MSSTLGASSSLNGSSDLGSVLSNLENFGQQDQHQSRRELDSSRFDLTSHLSSENLPSSEVEPEDAGGKPVWGTNVVLSRSRIWVKDFLKTFYLDDGDAKPYYMELIETAFLTDETEIAIDMTHVNRFSPALYRQMLKYPLVIITLFDHVLYEILTSDYAQKEDEPKPLTARPFNLLPDHVTHMRSLDPQDLDRLVSIQGMVIRSTGIIPEMEAAAFECNRCCNMLYVEVDRHRIEEPIDCSQCNGKHCFRLIHNRSRFGDCQQIKLQEAPEDIPEGETPYTVNLLAFSQLVDVVVPGDRCQVTGILRCEPVRVSRRMTKVNSCYRTYIDVIHFSKNREGRVEAPKTDNAQEFIAPNSDESLPPSIITDRNERLKALGQDPEIYSKLVSSFAPNIWELDDVKRGLLCLLFGGANKDLKNAGRGRFRGDLNILLCGDPGTSKSQLLKYVHSLAPRGVYTSGKGSSAVGLTAYIKKDPDTRDLVLESGALVLSDQGVCCIDEFDKMNDMTRAVLHEVMEQQTVSVAKAGIICTLNARTSLLASANPIGSRYQPNLSVVDNLKMPPTLLSRFDLIYLILDKPSESGDSQLANHIISLYYEDSQNKAAEISKETLAQYIAFAREEVSPVLTEDASSCLVENYLEMRKSGTSGKTITATPRQLESMIRISEGLARMHFRSEVLRSDVIEAVRLMKAALQVGATDQTTGAILMDDAKARQ